MCLAQGPQRSDAGTIVHVPYGTIVHVPYTMLGYVIIIPWTVRGDYPRALASGLPDVQVNKHGITILYHVKYQCRNCTS